MKVGKRFHFCKRICSNKGKILQVPVFSTQLALSYMNWRQAGKCRLSAPDLLSLRKCPMRSTPGKWRTDTDKTGLGFHIPQFYRRNCFRREIFLDKESQEWRKCIFARCFVNKQMSVSFRNVKIHLCTFFQKESMLVLTPCTFSPFPVTFHIFYWCCH